MMPFARWLVLVAVLYAMPLSAQDRRPPTVDDLLGLVQLSGAEISPDGRRVIYTRCEITNEITKWSDNKRVTSIWIAGTDDQRVAGDQSRVVAEWIRRQLYRAERHWVGAQ